MTPLNELLLNEVIAGVEPCSTLPRMSRTFKKFQASFRLLYSFSKFTFAHLFANAKDVLRSSLRFSMYDCILELLFTLKLRVAFCRLLTFTGKYNVFLQHQSLCKAYARINILVAMTLRHLLFEAVFFCRLLQLLYLLYLRCGFFVHYHHLCCCCRLPYGSTSVKVIASFRLKKEPYQQRLLQVSRPSFFDVHHKAVF